MVQTRHRNKRSLGIAAAAALALAVVTGCSGANGTSGAAAESGEPVRGGRFTYATDIDSGCVDPQQSPTSAAELLARGALDSLVYQDPRSGDLFPWLAESWTLSPDGKSVEFTLRPGVTFSDGTPFDATAVKANFDRIVDPGTKSALAPQYMAGYTGTTVVAPLKVKVDFSQPNTPFVQTASTAFFGIQSPASFAAGTAATCRKVVGSGPFTMDNYTPGQSVDLIRRPGYAWAPTGAANQGEAHLDRVVIKFVAENGVRTGSLRAGQLDAAVNIPPAQIEQFDGGGFHTVRREQTGAVYGLWFNQKRPQWQDPKVRQAVARAINTEEIVRTLYKGKFAKATSVLAPGTPGYVAVPLAGAFSVDVANRLLDEAGWVRGGDGVRTKDGKRLTADWFLVSPAREQRDVLAQLVQAQLKVIGVQVELKPVSFGEALGHQGSGDWDFNDVSFARGSGDILRLMSGGKLGGASARPDPAYDAEIATASSTTDASLQRTVYGRLQTQLVEQAYVVPVYNPTMVLGAADRVGGLALDAEGLPDFQGTWIVS